MVMRVKASPAREPKALEPPEPPKAPARPPPWPFWIRTSPMRIRLDKSSTKFNTPGNQSGTAHKGIINSAITAPLLASRPAVINRHYKLSPRPEKTCLLIHLSHPSILDVSSHHLYSCQSGQAYRF